MTFWNQKHPGRSGRGCPSLATVCVVAVYLLPLTGCGPATSDVESLSAIVAKGDHQDWDVSQPTIKAHLIHNPNDMLGHYLYGLSFLHREIPQLTYAEGEFLTSLTLLRRAEDFPADIIGMERNEFTGQLHRKTALVYMRAFREAMRLGFAENYGEKLLQKANEQVEMGLKANPTSTHLLEYAEFLREALGLDNPNAPKIITKRVDRGASI